MNNMKKITSITLHAVLLLTIAVSCSSSSSSPSTGADADSAPVLSSHGRSSSDCGVEAFLSSTCGYCKRMEAFLKERKIPYTKRDVLNDYWSRQDFYALGGTGVPLLKIGNTIINGFKPDEVEQAYRTHCNIPR